MDQYRTWLSGLKNALTEKDIDTLLSNVNTALEIRCNIPKEHRYSTFIGQEENLELLSGLPKALLGGAKSRNLDELMDSVYRQIGEWERMNNTTSTPSHISSPLSHSQSEASYGPDVVEYSARQMPLRAPRLRNLEACSIPDNRSHFYPSNAESMSGTRLRNKSYWPRSMSAGIMSNAELPNGQTCADSQHLMTKCQAIEKKLYQDTEWKIGVDQKLQALLDFLGASRPMATPSGLPTNQSPPPPNYGQGPQNYYGQGPQNYGQVPQNYGQVPQNYGQAALPYVQALHNFQVGPSQTSTFGHTPFGQTAPAPLQTVAGDNVGPYSGPEGGLVAFSPRMQRAS